MRTRSKLVLAGLGAAMLMAFALNAASARNLSISNQNIRVTFTNIELGAEGVLTASCRVTLEGSLHARTIQKVAGTLLGYITRARNTQCNTGVTILAETLPWHLRYVAFSGVLPNITLLLLEIRNIRFLVEPGFGFRCLFTGNLLLRFVRSTATGAVTGAEVPLQEVPTVSGGGFGCPVSTGSVRSGSNGSVALLGTTNTLTLTLI